jgi:secretion/DNA translocation related TadE-like protein
MMAVLLTITVAGFYVGSAVVARHRAQAVSDLAALGAAARLTAGVDAACAQAETIAGAMAAVVADCVVDDLDVVVSVDVRVGLAGWVTGPARAAARAGPVDDAG